MGSKAKYHHLIPRTYLSAWANTSGTLLVKNIETGGIADKNKGNFFGINYYHSIIAGMPICTKDDAEKIFASLKDYNVVYQGVPVTDPLELNRIYYDFNSWEITRKSDGSVAAKKPIKADIDQVKVRDIETAWATKYENKWPAIRDEIEKNVLNVGNGEIPEFEKDFLTLFYTSMDWRGFASDPLFLQSFDKLGKNIIALDEIEIPEDERKLSFFETEYDYFKHCLLLNFFRKFLNEDGPMYFHACQNMKYTSFHFLITDGPTYFITSDNPSFWCNREDGLRVGLMPIEPRILMIQGKDTYQDQLYSVTHITETAVKKYNRWIEENAEQYVVLDNSRP